MPKTVVILGAGWAGLPLAHKLLKYTAPKTSVRVILVSPNSHFFWNVAATRGIIPGAIPDEQLFLPIEDAFKQHPGTSFRFLLGSAQEIIPEKNSVTVRAQDGTEECLRYDQLVIATGSRMASGLPLKSLGPHETTMAAWRDLQQQIQRSKSIVIAGAGATGVEVAGELAARYGSDKTITLIMSEDKPLSNLPGALPSVRHTVDSDLQRLGVHLLRNSRVSETMAAGSNGQARIRLSTGAELTADCYLALHGIKLNTSFIPPSLLDGKGNVNQEPTMQVTGVKNIWAIGDAGSLEPKQLTVIDSQVIHLASALDAVLSGDDAVSAYKPTNKTMLFLSLGTKFATGQIGSWKVWGYLV
ncbi:hypothetical protein Golomagni_07732, partial [Golovinomyces magnicellulatus]